MAGEGVSEGFESLTSARTSEKVGEGDTSVRVWSQTIAEVLARHTEASGRAPSVRNSVNLREALDFKDLGVFFPLDVVADEREVRIAAPERDLRFFVFALSLSKRDGPKIGTGTRLGSGEFPILVGLVSVGEGESGVGLLVSAGPLMKTGWVERE